ncbi:hypothetical protein EV702DRAFT_1046048 [Suillus placidus]|uniref:Uncharacterized protein n=1 Tax=Suillus placidus TaxID=48579 RepID=A0A9P6ZTY1_9AGAM|nr:hypothetical protein EV702DRAFT_1046048 [Suillus placidus]
MGDDELDSELDSTNRRARRWQLAGLDRLNMGILLFVTVVVFHRQSSKSVLLMKFNLLFLGSMSCLSFSSTMAFDDLPSSSGIPSGHDYPTSIPDGDWEEDNFPPASALAPSEPTAPPPPPPLSSFLRDIETYFGQYEVAPSAQYTRSVERFVSILHFHLGFRLAASTTTPRGRSTTFDDWTRKTQWAHLCKLVGDDPMNIVSIPEAQKHVITCFIGYLVTLPQSQLSDILPDLWDLGPNPSLSTSNAHIRVSYVQQPKQRFYIIEPRLSFSLVPWKLAVSDAITAVMCLRRDWGSDILTIACNLLEKGIAIKTLLPMSVSPRARCPLTEAHLSSIREPTK